MMKSVLVKFLIVTLCASMLLAGCATDPNTGAVTPSKAGWGAMIGAASGALLGVIVGGDRRAAIIGAGVGALAGGVAGHYMDQQAKQLREATAGTGIQVNQKGEQVILDMPGNVTFDTGSARIKPEFFPILNKVANVIVTNEKTYVDVYGHTDSVGSDEFNQTLSEQRAQSVANYLERRGVAPARLVTRGFGKTQPIASNDTPEGRSQNRRVEIVLTPLT